MPAISVNHVQLLEAEQRKKERKCELKIESGNKTRLLLVRSKLGLAVGLFESGMEGPVIRTIVPDVFLVPGKIKSNGSHGLLQT
jgi:hypothetical protein